MEVNPSNQLQRVLATRHGQARLLLLGGLALLLAFPFPGWWPLVFVGLVPLALLVEAPTRPRVGLLLTLAFGVLWYLAGLRWLIDVTFGGYVALCVYMGMYWPATWWTLRRLRQRWGFPFTLALPLAWTVLEFVRGHVPAGGFGWFALSHALAPWQPEQGVSRLLQVADLGGEWTVTLLIAMVNGLLADMVRCRWLAVPEPGAPWHRPLHVPAAATALLVAGAWGYGQWRLVQTPANLRPGPRLALVQTNVPQDNKISPQPAQVAADWQRMLELCRQAVQLSPRPQVVVWPETMAPAALNRAAIDYYRDAPTAERGDETYRQQIEQFVTDHHVDLLVGAHAKMQFEIITADDGNQYIFPLRRYNAAYHFSPAQVVRSSEPPRYDKMHRVPFGEYIPWVDAAPTLKRWFIRLLSPYDFDYSLQAGAEVVLFDLPAGEGQSGVTRTAAPICFEDGVPRVVREMVYGTTSDKRVDLLVNLTNDGWYGASGQGPQHFQLAVMRCVENRTPMARCVNTGVTGFISSTGQVTSLLTVDGQHQAVDGVVAQAVELDQRSSVFGAVGRVPMVTLLVLTGGFVFTRRRRGSKLAPEGG